MLRVLHLIYDDPGNPWVAGGGAVRVFEIYRRLAPKLTSVTVATGRYPGARDERIEGIQYLRLGSPAPYFWSRATYALAAGRLLAKGNFDAAVFDFSTYTPLRIPRGQPVGITVHHLSGETAGERWGLLGGQLLKALEKRMLRRGKLFSATSLATHDHLRAVVGPDAEIRRIGAGVPDELFELERREADFLLYFGRLDWFQKGLDILLEALRLLAIERPGILLKVAGRGADSKRLLEAAGKLGVDDNLEFLGVVGDAERKALFSGARMLLMPSRFEGFGMVAAEAMAAGVPVIAADVGSLPEVIGGRESGILVPPRDPVALAGAVERLLADTGERARLSRGARDSAERFRWTAIAEEHFAFLKAIQGNVLDVGTD